MSSSPQVFTYTEEPQNYYNPPNFEYSKDETLLFTDKSIRIGFARKVFSILLIQILFTFGLVALLTFHTEINSKLHKSMYIQDIFVYASFGFALVDLAIILIILFQPKTISKTPWNYVVLALVTICTSIPLAILTAYIETKQSVFFVIGMMVCMVVSLLLFSLQTRQELTYLTGFFISLTSTAAAGAIMYFVVRDLPENKDQEGMVAGILGACLIVTVLFGMIWIAIARGIMFGEPSSKMACSPEDFILASMLLYIITIAIFVLILLIITASQSNAGNNVRGSGCGHWFWFYPVYGTSSVHHRNTEEGVNSQNGSDPAREV
ncbi:protein lifeguard 2 [Folsomia candida]|nr:protein lifeguard 2 [Folsomia candida]